MVYLDLDGIAFRFKVDNFRASSAENWDTEWCKVDLTLQAGNWLNYKQVSSETIVCKEVESIRDRIDDLVNGRLASPTIIDFIEPDYELHLFPKEDCRNNPSVLYMRPGIELIDISMDWVVSFWAKDGALTANRLLLCFGRTELEKLVCYLKYITGVIDTQDTGVQKLISDGHLRY